MVKVASLAVGGGSIARKTVKTKTVLLKVPDSPEKLPAHPMRSDRSFHMLKTMFRNVPS